MRSQQLDNVDTNEGVPSSYLRIIGFQAFSYLRIIRFREVSDLRIIRNPVFLDSGKQFEKADLEKCDILNLYRSDIMKIEARCRSKVLTIFDSIPGLLSSNEKRVVFKDIKEGSYAQQYEEKFFWLPDFMMSNECFLCNDPQVGLSLNENRSYVKCYLSDTGLLVSYTFDERSLMEEYIY